MFARTIRWAAARLRPPRTAPSLCRIPLDQAEHILATFGITRPTPAYERWVKPDGFDLKDFDSVLFDSPLVVGVDWREPLGPALEAVKMALDRLGVSLRIVPRVDPAKLGEAAVLSCGGGPEAVVSHGREDDNLDGVVRGIQSVVPPELEFRAWSGNAGRDSWAYAVLPRDEWADLERRSPETIASLFQPVPAR